MKLYRRTPPLFIEYDYGAPGTCQHYSSRRHGRNALCSRIDPTQTSDRPSGEPQAESNGLLEVTVIISGDTRKRNIPGAALGKSKKSLMAGSKNRVWPVEASARSSFNADLATERRGRVTRSAMFRFYETLSKALWYQLGISCFPFHSTHRI